jgi:plastocyanin
MNRIALGGAALLAAAMLAAPVSAADDVYTISINNHRFEPEEIIIPAGKKVKLVVKNMDATPEEFESYELDREKVIAAGGEVVIFIGPLDPGTYSFIGEFHEDTAKGRFVVK